MVDKWIIVKSIDEAVEKCGKPHITNLPYDLRTNDIQRLEVREKAISKELTKQSKKVIKKWHQISDMVDEWNNNIPSDKNSNLAWEGIYSLEENNLERLLKDSECSLIREYRSLNKYKFADDIQTHRTENLDSSDVWVYGALINYDTDIFDEIINWSNQPWDWKEFNINNMGTFRRRINKLQEEESLLRDYKIEYDKVHNKIINEKANMGNYEERLNAKVNGGAEVYDLAKRTRGIHEIHNESDGDDGSGMFRVVADYENARRLANKVGATEFHEEDDGLYTIIVPYKLS